MDVDSLIRQLGVQNQATETQAANLPAQQADLRQMLFGGNDQTTNSLQQNEQAKINELFAHDQMLSQKFGGTMGSAPTQGGQPQTPQPPATVAQTTGLTGVDPTLISDPFPGMQQQTQTSANSLSELVDIANQIQKRHDVLGTGLDNAIKLLNAKIDAGKQKSSDIKDQIDALLKEQQINQTSSGLTKAQQLASSGLQQDIKSGTTFKDLYARYSGELPAYLIRQMYNQGPMAKKYGPANETDTDLASGLAFEKKGGAKLPTADETKATQTLSTLSTINNLQSALKNDRSLQSVVGNPVYAPILDGLIKNHQSAVAQKLFGLSSDAVQALSEFTQLQGQGDRDMIGGRLSGYMLGIFGSSFPALDKTLESNGKLLDALKSRITAGADVYAKNQRFDGWQDLPGFEKYANTGNQSSGGTTIMKDPSGKQWSVPNNKVSLFKQNGYK